MSRQILLCESFEHAEVVNQLVMAYLETEEGARGSQWSDILVSPDGSQQGILWGSPVAAILGTPEDDPSIILIDDARDEWQPMEPPDEPTSQ